MDFLVQPTKALQPYIQNIWYCKRTIKAPETTVTLPFGRIEMVFNFSGDYLVRNGNNHFEKREIWMTGQLTEPSITLLSGDHECMGVVFTPLGLGAFSNVKADALTDKSIPLDQIFGNEILSLADEFRAIHCSETKIERLERFFLEKLVVPGNLNTIQRALSILNSNNGGKKVTVQYLCEDLKISRNSLNKHFRKYIGLSASTYIQQKIFNQILKDIRNIPQERLIEVGYNYHFFDQAHFIKQFQRFAGISPGQYLQFAKTNAISSEFPNFISQ